MLGQRLAILLSALLLAGTCARAATTHEVGDETELNTVLTNAADGDTIRLTGTYR